MSNVAYDAEIMLLADPYDTWLAFVEDFTNEYPDEPMTILAEDI